MPSCSARPTRSTDLFSLRDSSTGTDCGLRYNTNKKQYTSFKYLIGLMLPYCSILFTHAHYIEKYHAFTIIVHITYLTLLPVLSSK